LQRELKEIELDLDELKKSGSEQSALSGLQPRSTAALEDFCRTVLLDAFTRLAWNIPEGTLRSLISHPRPSQLSECKKCLHAWISKTLEQLLRWRNAHSLHEMRKPIKEIEESIRNERDVEMPRARKRGDDAKVRESLDKLTSLQGELKEKGEELSLARLTAKRILDFASPGSVCEHCKEATSMLYCPCCECTYCSSCADAGFCRTTCDVHPTDKNRDEAAEKLFRWTLEHCIRYFFDNGQYEMQYRSGKKLKQAIADMPPKLEDFKQCLLAFFPQGSELDLDKHFNDVLQDEVLSLRVAGDAEVQELKMPAADGLSYLLKLKYGLRCTAVHGNHQQTLKQALRNFPTAPKLAYKLLGWPEPRTRRPILNEDMKTIDLNGYWDLYTSESVGSGDLACDWSLENDLAVKVRSRCYTIQHTKGPDASMDVDVICRLSDSLPSSTTLGKLRKDAEGRRLSFRAHFCGPQALRKGVRHTWFEAQLQLVCIDGRHFFSGQSITHWDREDDNTRREQHYDRSDRGMLCQIQLHPEQEFPEPQPFAEAEEVSRVKAAIKMSQYWRRVYESAESSGRRSFQVYDALVLADLSLTRLMSNLCANVAGNILRQQFQIGVSEKHPPVQVDAAEDLLPMSSLREETGSEHFGLGAGLDSSEGEEEHPTS